MNTKGLFKFQLGDVVKDKEVFDVREIVGRLYDVDGDVAIYQTRNELSGHIQYNVRGFIDEHFELIAKE